MLDFVAIKTSTRISKTETTITVYPEFLVQPSEDLMIRGRAFYAVWDEDAEKWSRDESTVMRIVDDAIRERCSDFPESVTVEARYLRNFSSKKWSEFLSYCASLPDNFHELDNSLVFSGETPKKEDYSTKSLPYPLKPGAFPAYQELMGTLYDPIELQKLEWAVGSVISGDSKKIQKFIVLYGSAGSGKSTFLQVVQQLFEGYYNVFEAKALTSNNNSFALETFRGNPLVSIQHDGDLSRIEDNTKLNSIVSHEEMIVNEKRKQQYSTRFHTMLFLGTNRPVKITDSKSGVIRRLIDVQPSGNTVPFDRYQVLMAQIKFELGAIASHCLDVYLRLGIDAYDGYRATEMISATNDFYGFVEDHYDIFKSEDGTTLAQAWELYKQWAQDTAVRYPLARRGVMEELKEYFEDFYQRRMTGDGIYLRNVYRGFKLDKFSYVPGQSEKLSPKGLDLLERTSMFDKTCSGYPAQLATRDGLPALRWDDVKTVLADIDTSKLHYVRLPENHIVVDFDLVGEDGEKDLELNLQAASKWPTTYAELSKSGKGVHLHYFYDGDPLELSSSYSDHIEIKVFSGKASLRRKLTRCNDQPIATISSGLPKKKGGKKVINFEGLKNEKAMRTLIKMNLQKKIHPGTKPSVEFIKKILDDAYNDGMHYDVSDLRPDIIAFANNSTHHSLYCMKLVSQMPFHSDEPSEPGISTEDIVFFDVEVFPNLFVIVWKRQGEFDPVRMINPTPMDVEMLMKYRLVGFNNRRYDNHILYARLLGYSNQQLYEISQGILNKNRSAFFGEAYGLSYTDILDFSSKKQSLKKFEIELGVHHMELGLPWDEPVPENLWDKVAEYCANDVICTEAVFNARQADFEARKVMAELSGLTVNDTTRAHATRIIFGTDKNPQKQFVYTDLSEMFPGYKYEAGVSTYRGEVVGEGGYVYAEPGMYFGEIDTYDIAGMHPTSADKLNIFGKYTDNFRDIVRARLACKHHDKEALKGYLGGKLAKYAENDEKMDALAAAFKIIVNSVYGYTKASFDCEFRDPRNVDNIVAKRGALFMINLKHEVQERGFKVLHIKTDSIKVLDPTPEIRDFIYSYGEAYGYTFEVESVYDRFALVNDAVYIARGKNDGKWTATGLQFAVPYVFKTLFSHEPYSFDDFCETKAVTGSSKIYLDKNEELPPGEHNYVFVGGVGQFTPVLPGRGGGELVREKDGKYYALSGTKGVRWLESEIVRTIEDRADDVNVSYYDALVDKAKETLSKYGDLDEFLK